MPPVQFRKQPHVQYKSWQIYEYRSLITFCSVLISTIYSCLCFRRRCWIILVVLSTPIKVVGLGGTQRVQFAKRIPLFDRCSVDLKKCQTGLRLFFFAYAVSTASVPSPFPAWNADVYAFALELTTACWGLLTWVKQINIHITSQREKWIERNSIRKTRLTWDNQEKKTHRTARACADCTSHACMAARTSSLSRCFAGSQVFTCMVCSLIQYDKNARSFAIAKPDSS